MAIVSEAATTYTGSQLDTQCSTAYMSGEESISCTECLRRKQKCNKQWPCKHCQDRRAPYLCDFKARRPRNSPASKDAQETIEISNLNPAPGLHTKRKISYITEPDDEAIVYASRQYHLEKDLEDLGMVGHGRNSKLREILGEAFDIANKLPVQTIRRDDQPLDAFPPRPYTDILIYNFLDNINFVYCICHRESLLQEYDSWWQSRHTGPDNVLEGLLLRLMAISAQFLPTSTCERLESVMSEDIVILKRKWHRLAEARHREIRPGKGDLKHVQQQFLSATYYKTEALFVDSWHSLSAAIHTAQELNMHRDSEGCDINDFERELRRQVWCSLYAWDKLTAFFFDRPPRIHRGRTRVVEPDPSLHQDARYPDLPSPILSRILELRLATIVGEYLDDDPEDAGIERLASAQKDVKRWLHSLPSEFRIPDANASWDSQHPRITYSRLGLHITAYSALFSISKACLTNIEFPQGSTPAERERLRASCTEYCIRLTDVIDRLTLHAPHARFFMAFCLFETSATICAAMIKDTQRILPQRTGAARALGRSKAILDRLGHNTVVAKGSAKIMDQLIECLRTMQPEISKHLSEGEAWELNIDHGASISDFDTVEHDISPPRAGNDSLTNDGRRIASSKASDEQLPKTDGSLANPDQSTDPEKLAEEISKGMDALSGIQTWDWYDLGLDLTDSSSADIWTAVTDNVDGNQQSAPWP